MNYRIKISAIIFSFTFLAFASMPQKVKADIVIYPSETVGPIKLMNAVNNGPIKAGSEQTRGNFDAYRAAHIPYARTHDASFCAAYGGEHSVDISAVFPDFNKKVTDEKAYDFTLTDLYLKSIQDAGTGIFFRLGQKIEHAPKKYYILPPKDFKKWAQICEHIIRHYTEGWDNGYKWNIKYWEIWNEPDLDYDNDAWKTNPKTWGGSQAQFFEFYKTTALHLKKCFPHLKIGGPAVCYNDKWAETFLQYMQQNNIPMDFFSWHSYSRTPEEMANNAEKKKQLLVKYGYSNSESILDEWNYVKGWTADFPYTVNVIKGQKGAAFTAGVMNACQQKPVDMLMYYDTQPTVFNGLFDLYSFAPTQCYYSFYAWNKLLEFGQQVKATGDYDDIYFTAACKDGKIRLMVARYNDDDNQTAAEKVTVRLASGAIRQAISHVTDGTHLYTEVPVDIKDGTIELWMEANSFTLLELE